MDPYGLACVQCNTRVVNDAGTNKDSVIKENLARDLELIDYLGREPRYRPKIILFPEFFLTGVPESRTLEAFRKRAIEVPGTETDKIAEKAIEYDAYIAGNVFGVDEKDWPGRALSINFIIDPKGKIALKGWKHNYVQALLAPITSPGDVLTEYIKKYGEENLFPVLDTPLGKIGVLTCYDLVFPETARCYTLSGAEILLHPTGEGYPFAQDMELARRVRAWENVVYLASANNGLMPGSTRPVYIQRGHSEILDYEGRILRCVDGPGEAIIMATINIDALRFRRAQPGTWNFIPALRASLFAQVYQKADLWPTDYWAKRTVQSNAEAEELQRKILQKLFEKKIFTKP